ncbi:MAG: hypothetical protein AB7P76_02330 [Candidatus Melainabacteria bacterium]
MSDYLYYSEPQANSPAGGESALAVPRMVIPDHLTLMDLLLPPAAVPLIGLMLLVMPLVLLTAESLLVPLIEWARSQATMEGSLQMEMLPFLYFIKLGVFIILAFLGCFQLVQRIKVIYYSQWAQCFPRPHPLHVDYWVDDTRAVYSMVTWSLYRFLMTLVPPIAAAIATAIVGTLELYLMNALYELPFLSLPIQYTLGIFLMLMMCMLTGLAFLNAVWNVFTTITGECAAATEPDLHRKTIADRCNRIAFSTPLSYFLYPLYLVFMLAVLAEAVLFLYTTDIQDVIGLKVNVFIPVLFTGVTFFSYIALSYLRFVTYHYGIARYYQKLPKQLKDCFNPPPPLADRLELEESLSEPYRETY